MSIHKLSRFLERVGTIWVHRGTKEAISFVKERRSKVLLLMARLGSHPNQKPDRHLVKGLSPFSLSKIVVQYQKGGSHLLRGVSILRLFLTVLTMLRSLTLPVQIDLEPITAGPMVNYQGPDLLSPSIPVFWRTVRSRVKIA